jgi:hypothetical protein
MFILILLLIGVLAVLAVFVTAWSLWLQAYLYTEPANGLMWRGPLAGGAIAIVVGLWVFFDYQNPGRYRPLWEFSSREESKPFPELTVPSTTGKEEVYKLRPGSRNDYRTGGLSSGKALPTRPSQITVMEGSEKSVFKPELDEKGNFKQQTAKSFGVERKEPLRYLDEKGRVMYEDALGQLVSRTRYGWLFGNLFLNFALLAAFFLALWLLMQFQWPHALGQAIVLWVVMLLFVLPPLLTRAEEVARSRATPVTT